MDDLIHREVLIGKLLLLREVIFQSRPQLRGTAIEDGRAIQHPFFLRDVVIPNAACVRINAGEQLSVNGKILIRCEAERSLGQERSDSGRDLVGLLRMVLFVSTRKPPLSAAQASIMLISLLATFDSLAFFKAAPPNKPGAFLPPATYEHTLTAAGCSFLFERRTF